MGNIRPFKFSGEIIFTFGMGWERGTVNNWFEKSTAEIDVCKMYCSGKNDIFLDSIIVLKKIHSVHFTENEIPYLF